MKFLADQDVYQLTVEFLRQLGHKVTKVSKVGLARATDEEILAHAVDHKFILITRDNDYGALVFLKHRKHSGVIFLKIEPEYVNLVHAELKKIFREHPEEDFSNCFIVIEPGRHRIRR